MSAAMVRAEFERLGFTSAEIDLIFIIAEKLDKSLIEVLKLGLNLLGMIEGLTEINELQARGMGGLLKKPQGTYTRADMHEAWRSGIITAFNGMNDAVTRDPFINNHTRKEYRRCLDSARVAVVELARLIGVADDEANKDAAS